MRNTLIPILVAICLFITGVAILNIQLWYSAKAEYLAGARYAADNINHILEEASQATQTAVNIAGKECNLEEQYQLGTEAALKPHLRTIIILKQGIVWCTSLPGNRVLLSRIPVFPDSNLLFGFAPIFPDTCYHLTHYWLAAVDIPVASDNPVHYADAIRYNARTPLQGSLLPLTRLVWA